MASKSLAWRTSSIDMAVAVALPPHRADRPQGEGVGGYRLSKEKLEEWLFQGKNVLYENTSVVVGMIPILN